ncbi:MAG: T9SS type A sorting domain-containing protein [bacterium]
MKKLIPLLLVLMAVSLHSQEAKYWEKIDFQFDSGIKIIDCYKKISFDYSNPFIIITDSNQIIYYQFYYGDAVEINNSEISGNIIDTHVIKNDSLTLILILTDYQVLYISKDFGESWESIDSVTNVATKNPNNFSNDNDIIIISTSDSGICFSEDYCDNWNGIPGIDKNKTIKQFTVTYYYVYALTNDLELYYFNRFDNNWEYLMNLNGVLYLYSNYPGSIKNLKIIEVSDFPAEIYCFFQDTTNTFYSFYSINNQNHVYQFNNRIGYPDSFYEISSFSVFNRIIVMLYDDIPIPVHFGIIGTKNRGVFFMRDIHGSIENFSDEFIEHEISAVESNANLNPELCFVGTKDGELYYSLLKLDVKEYSKNILNTQIFPQPASTKARLSFTLQMESRVSVKLYNTLGIEQFAIEDGFFSEGENSIPLDVSGLADGMYFVAIQYEGRTVVEKLVVRR